MTEIGAGFAAPRNVSDAVAIVTVRTDVPGIEVNVRTGPHQGDQAFGTLHAGDQRQAYCWTIGDNVGPLWGTTHDVWIAIVPEHSPGYDVGWVWAGVLKGDKYAGVPDQC
ncbi:MAG: hypothetical protein WBV74_02905 [Pseudonocardiaceae bacterium]